jgi:hypothetical protein
MHNTINPFSSQSATSELPVKDKTAFGQFQVMAVHMSVYKFEKMKTKAKLCEI